MKRNEIITKLEEIRDNNPDFAPVLENAFPEIMPDVTPFVFKNTLFLKEKHPNNLYLLFCENCIFKVRNLRDNKVWKAGQIKASGDFKGKGAYLTQTDFELLLKKAGCPNQKIAFLYDYHIRQIHETHIKWRNT